MNGVVLPVVLVVLTVLTGLVVTQIRRAALDERLAGNTRESVQLDSAVQTVLRWCEARVIAAPLDTVVIQPNTSTAAAPVWRALVNWTTDTNSLNFTGANLLPGINANPSCVIEDATCELTPPVSGRPMSGCNGIDPRWRKFRITAQVSTPAPDMVTGFLGVAGNRFVFAQSEIRVYAD